MAQKKPPAEPLVVILGSTGTGKSELAVHLATRFNGEVINADAMQMYRGLPIITNKISAEEQRGIPHHLLGNISLDEETWVVGRFKQEAGKAIKEIRSRGRLPIVVGGTHYYTNGLLFHDNLVNEEPNIAHHDETQACHEILDGPTEVMLAKLREVDPLMADRWHPNDRRKIRRSLEIFLTTGRKASDIYAEQQERKGSKRASAEASDEPTPWQALMFWVYSQPDVLNMRLNKRVDKMVEAGLVGETAELFDYLQQRDASGKPVDRTTGIWQSIGLKEFEPYLQAIGDGCGPEQVKKAHTTAIEDTKTATRRYAKYQRRWIAHKTIPLLRDERALDRLYVLDSSDLDRWREDVADKGATLAGQFLAGEVMPAPEEVSETARKVLAEAVEASQRQDVACRRVCQVCDKMFLTEWEWGKHLRSHVHDRAVRHAKRTALVIADAGRADGRGRSKGTDLVRH